VPLASANNLQDVSSIWLDENGVRLIALWFNQDGIRTSR